MASRAARLVALGQEIAKKGNRLVPPESPSPSVDSEAFAAFSRIVDARTNFLATDKKVLNWLSECDETKTIEITPPGTFVQGQGNLLQNRKQGKSDTENDVHGTAVEVAAPAKRKLNFISQTDCGDTTSFSPKRRAESPEQLPLPADLLESERSSSANASCISSQIVVCGSPHQPRDAVRVVAPNKNEVTQDPSDNTDTGRQVPAVSTERGSKEFGSADEVCITNVIVTTAEDQTVGAVVLDGVDKNNNAADTTVPGEISANIEIFFTDASGDFLQEEAVSSLDFSDVQVLSELALIPEQGEAQADEENGAVLQDVTDAVVANADNAEQDAPLPARSRNPANWKRNQVKMMKNAGLAHTSLRGKEVKAASLGPRCGDSCKRECLQVTDLNRKKIFDKFYSQGDRTEKWRYICSYARACKVKRRTVIIHDDNDAKRKSSYEYFLPRDDQYEVQVCQTMFINTLGISTQTLRTAMAKRKDKFGTISPIKMGKSRKMSALSKQKDDSVRKHILSFPTVESHYCRKNSTARYLDETLNKRKMHSLYVLECEGKGMKKEEIASLRIYRDVLKTYKLKFYKPKKDQCSKCLAWKATPFQSKTPEKAEKMKVHLSQKDLGRELKKADADLVASTPDNRKELCVMTCDLQKMLSSPKGENSEFYYKSKFSSYNFTVFVSGEQQGYCYTWDQTIGKKGCTEISSCLWDFIQGQVQRGIKEFRIYSDNCAAQNKNKYLFSMYVMASIKFKIKIIHRYLETGHTQMQCDAMHARIENHMKNTDVHHPSQWIVGMKMAKIQEPKYIVKEMLQEELFDFSPLVSYQSWQNIRTSTIREIVFCGSEPGKVYFKTLFDGNAVFAQVLSPRPGRPVNWSTIKLKRKYSAKFLVRPDVLKGLQDLCKSGAIKEEYQPFYMEFLPSIGREDEEVDSPEDSEYSDVEESGSEKEDSDDAEASGVDDV